MIDINALADTLSRLTVVEAARLVSTLEERWGVRAQVSYVAPAKKIEEKIYEPKVEPRNLVLTGYPAINKIPVIKTLRDFRPDLGLREAKLAAESLPFVIIADATDEQAEPIAMAFGRVGAVVELVAVE